MPSTVASLAHEAHDARVLGDGDVAITDVCYDSRAAAPGALFFCVPGSRTDGHDHAASAVSAGAVAVVVERVLDLAVPQIVVPSVRGAMGPISAGFFGHPSHAMTLVGVTGTNGKTTSTYLLESVFRTLGMRTGLIGTIETHIADEIIPGVRTTPEAPDVQRMLARMRDAGVRGAAMEVSSHGLEQHRVAGTRYACAVFTNLTQDHLDYHGTMEAYFASKMLLFQSEYAVRAAINIDDPWGRRLLTRIAIPAVTFGIDNDDADVRAVSYTMDAAGSLVVADVRGRAIDVRVPIPARHNVENALGVIAAAVSLDLPLDAVVRGIALMPGVPGRLERIPATGEFTVLVDYAHTADSLESVLRATRELVPAGGRLVVVFGCGGDRDRGKRPQMGRIGAVLADRTIITSDNPRSEEPRAIIAEIEQGARAAGSSYEVIVDRREAIAAAIGGASTGDVIVIAGKGHESGQEFADGHTIPFDDRVVARELLESR